MTEGEKIAYTAIGSFLVGILLYGLSLMKQRNAVKLALLVEINLLLRQAQDYRDYFAQTGHLWLQAGETQTEAPVFASARTTILAGSVPQLHLMSIADVRKVLSFYAHFQDTEKLIEILFNRLAQNVQTKTPLSAETAALTDGRRKRILVALESLVKDRKIPVLAMSDLPLQYEMPSTTIVANHLHAAIKPLNTRQELPAVSQSTQKAETRIRCSDCGASLLLSEWSTHMLKAHIKGQFDEVRKKLGL